MENGIKKIGVVIADKDEFIPFAECVKKLDFKTFNFFKRKGISLRLGGAEVTCLNSGVGKVNAAAACMHLIDSDCKIILNFGMSGGLHNKSLGGFLFPKRFIEHDFDLSLIGYKPYFKPEQTEFPFADSKLLEIAVKMGFELSETAVSGDKFICDESLSRYLYESFNASSCDMESAAIAAVCNAAEVPFAALRRISDSADENAAKTHRNMNRLDNASLPEAFLIYLEQVIKDYEY